MKKQLNTLAFVCLSTLAFSQSGAKWSVSGNATTTSDFLGTTNASPLIFKTNANQVAMFDINGNLILKKLSNGTNGIVFYDANGTLTQKPFTNNANNVLLGDGSWGNLSSISNIWQANGSNTFFNGKVGIGTSNPLFPLDVIGDARVSNNLYVGGGVVISDKISAITEIKGWDFKVDNDINIEGSSRLKGANRLDQGFTFDGTNGVSYSINNGYKTFHFGSNIGLKPTATPCAAAPYSGVLNQFGGWLQIYDPANPTTSGLLNMQTWSGGSSIDASVAGNTSTGGSAGLLLNYFCGNNTFINTGSNGGTVYLGTTKIGTQRIVVGTQHDNAKLSVDGKIIAKEIVVTQQSWADYVFANNYTLPNIYEVEKFYKANKHLPEIPSEKEVTANGVNVGDMEKLLLKKIEELTLYVVEQKKQADNQQVLIEKLSTELNQLKK